MPNQDNCCSICLDDIKEMQSTYINPECKHKFHTDCINPWFERNKKTCPFCRALLKIPEEIANRVMEQYEDEDEEEEEEDMSPEEQEEFEEENFQHECEREREFLILEREHEHYCEILERERKNLKSEEEREHELDREFQERKQEREREFLECKQKSELEKFRLCSSPEQFRWSSPEKLLEKFRLSLPEQLLESEHYWNRERERDREDMRVVDPRSPDIVCEHLRSSPEIWKHDQELYSVLPPEERKRFRESFREQEHYRKFHERDQNLRERKQEHYRERDRFFRERRQKREREFLECERLRKHKQELLRYMYTYVY